MSNFTKEDLANIEQAIATGELIVQRGDKKVQFRSIAELLRARDVIKNDLEAEQNKFNGGVSYASYSRD